jgi:hypothetical protein
MGDEGQGGRGEDAIGALGPLRGQLQAGHLEGFSFHRGFSRAGCA